jgi:Na+-transporting methylmalonyl-CoA/oxaloacetate decarboxylase gamma subunit
MTQGSNSSSTQQQGNDKGNSRGATILVTILGVGVVLALLFVGIVVVVRMASGPKPTVTSVPTLRPTYTSIALKVTEVPSVQIPAIVSTTVAVSATTETVEPSVTPVAGSPTTAAPPTDTPAPPTNTPRPPSPPATMDSPAFGIQAFLWWRPEVAHRDLGLIRDAGFTWVKQWFAWRDIEGKGKGQYDWSTADRVVDQVEEFGLKLIVRVDKEPDWAGPPPGNSDHFTDFISALATRYRGRIHAYQVWNEPNLAREWGNKPPNAQEYTGMLQKAYQAVKQADPNAIVVSAGLAPTTELSQRAVPDSQFIQAMYNAGAKPYFDMLGAHGAGYRAPPEKDPGEVANDPNYYNVGDPNCPGPACRIYCFRHVEDLRQIMVDNGDASKRVVVLEFGWTRDERSDSPYYWHRVEDQFVQGDYMVRAYQYAKAHWQPWIAVMSLIYMPDAKWTQNDEQYWWSVIEPSSVDQLRLKAPYVMLCSYIREERGLGRCPYAP